jgi:hypothetical protein
VSGCISTRSGLSPLAKLIPVIFLLWSLSSYWNLQILSNSLFYLLYICLLTDIHRQLLNVLPYYCSMYNSWSNYIQNLLNIHWCIHFKMFLIPLFLLVSIVLTVMTTSAAMFITLVLPESISEHFVCHLHFAALGFLNPRCHCVAQCLMLATVPGWDLAGYIGLRGNCLTPLQIVNVSSEQSL